jgi:hypothetical protein
VMIIVSLIALDTVVMKDSPIWMLIFIITKVYGTSWLLTMKKFVDVIVHTSKEMELTVFVSVFQEEVETTGVLVVELKLIILMMVSVNVKNGCKLTQRMRTVS